MSERNGGAQGLGPTRRELLRGAVGATAAWSMGQTLMASESHAEKSNSGTPLNSAQQAILKSLMDGNERYVTGNSKHHDFSAMRKDLASGQQPDTAVIRCADSRVAPELIFDQPLGELFVCGVAGNIPTQEIMASIEYAVSNLGTRLIVIMGHSKCGAVDATLEYQNKIDSLPGNLPGLLSQLLPSVLKAQKLPGDTLANAVKQNAVDAAARLTKMSVIVDEAVDRGDLGIASGVYNLSSGRFELNGAG